MPRGVAYSDDLKAQVLAAIFSGLSSTAAARQFGVGEATVRLWRDAYLADQQNAKSAHAITPADEVRFGALLADYLIANLRALKTQAELFGSREWLQGQPGSVVIDAHHALAERAVRLLSALEPQGIGPTDPDPEGD